MANLTDNCLSCFQTYYQQSLLPLEYVDFTFGGQQISLIGCFVESSIGATSFSIGPKICLSCLELLRTCHANKRVVIGNEALQKPSYTCATCCQLSPASNMLNMRLTVVNANGRQVNLEECFMVCRKMDRLTGNNLTICLACVSTIVEDYIQLPELMEFNHANVKIEPSMLESLSTDCKVEINEFEVSPVQDASNDLNIYSHEQLNNALKCSECPLKFESSKQTIQHKKKVHSVDNRYECEICEGKFTTKRYLAVHMDKHYAGGKPKKPKHSSSTKKTFSGSFRERVLQSKQALAALEQEGYQLGEYKCDRPGCAKTCRTGHTLKLHIQQKHEGFNVGTTCRLCDVKFNCRIKFKDHLAGHTMPNGQLRCNNCTEVFADYAEARKHLHAEPIPFECYHCKYTSPFLVLLRRHLWTYHFRKEFKCRQCDEVLGKYLDFKRHMAAHKQSTQNLQCDICLKKFLIKQSFDYHVNRWKNVFPCPRCDARCHTPGQLETHMETKHNEFFPCHICNQPFRNTYTMEKHLKRVHGVIPKAKCRKCGLAFDSPAELTSHKQNEHQRVGKTKYVCEHCGQGFDSKTSLAKHVQRHKTMIRFPCRECDRVYKTAESLNNHIQIIHLRVKKRRSTNMVYTCPKCPQWKFARHQALEGHMIVHNTENRAYFQCEMCGIAYTRRQKFDVHIKKCQKN